MRSRWAATSNPTSGRRVNAPISRGRALAARCFGSVPTPQPWMQRPVPQPRANHSPSRESATASESSISRESRGTGPSVLPEPPGVSKPASS